MSEIQLVDVDGGTPDTPPEIREEEDVPMEVAPPLKRGRGRPPGAKNKKKPLPGVSTSHTRPHRSLRRLPPRGSLKSVWLWRLPQMNLPMNRHHQGKSGLNPSLLLIAPAHRHKVMQNSQQQRVDRHAGRVQEYSSLLHEMLAY